MIFKRERWGYQVFKVAYQDTVDQDFLTLCLTLIEHRYGQVYARSRTQRWIVAKTDLTRFISDRLRPFVAQSWSMRAPKWLKDLHPAWQLAQSCWRRVVRLVQDPEQQMDLLPVQAHHIIGVEETKEPNPESVQRRHIRRLMVRRDADWFMLDPRAEQPRRVRVGSARRVGFCAEPPSQLQFGWSSA
ncbi:hypothetical protein [Acanthopleuribacter pedis]|uniref:Uncharacterized protein n=1 Tax=Acanthopleuribacter pedis TaxID=442870 RepID=A0A8J7Q291_9BACT|nr:hypothetical protein [Acanthopleuribacter pedis]MBO1317409.1 hypothetical protein [Acanthopleuribacter pedis]